MAKLSITLSGSQLAEYRENAKTVLGESTPDKLKDDDQLTINYTVAMPSIDMAMLNRLRAFADMAKDPRLAVDITGMQEDAGVFIEAGRVLQDLIVAGRKRPITEEQWRS